MADPPLALRPATPAGIAVLHALIERAYRGPAARAGWTHEADLLEGPRTDRATLAAIVASPADLLLFAGPAEAPFACVHLADRGGGLVYLGMLVVDPTRQADGIGRRLIAAAERHAARRFGATRMEMTVISRRTELVAYYARRGYRPTGEQRAFPIEIDPPLALAVLTRMLTPMPTTPFLPLDERVSVAGQIGPDDVVAAAAQGFATVINNRPDDEAPDQPAGAAIAAAATAAGLAYVAIPVGHDGFREDQIAAMAAALAAADGPVLAFCRSGTRSTFLWALASARTGADGATLAAQAAAQGYDLSPLRPLIG